MLDAKIPDFTLPATGGSDFRLAALAGKVDVIALVGGDGDYEPLLHYLKARGCKVEVWSWPVCTARRLREASIRGSTPNRRLGRGSPAPCTSPVDRATPSSWSSAFRRKPTKPSW